MLDGANPPIVCGPARSCRVGLSCKSLVRGDRWPMASHEKRIAWGLALLSSMFLTACAGAQREPMAQINDPNEATNRQALAVNQAVFGPISAGYHAVTPSIIRQGIGNVSANLNEPRIFANDLLQLRFSALATTAARLTHAAASFLYSRRIVSATPCRS